MKPCKHLFTILYRTNDGVYFNQCSDCKAKSRLTDKQAKDYEKTGKKA